MSDRFDLEQGIMACWSVVDDIKLIQDSIAEEKLSADQTFDVLNGLQALYNLKFEQLFGMFEELVQQRKII